MSFFTISVSLAKCRESFSFPFTRLFRFSTRCKFTQSLATSVLHNQARWFTTDLQKSTSYHQHIHLNCGSLHWPLTRGQRGNTNKRKHQKFICGDSGWCIAITGLLPRGCREGTHQVGLFNPRAKWKSLSEVILVGDTRWHWPQGNKSVIAIFDFGSFTKPMATAPWEIIEGKKQVCRTELGPTWGKSVFTMQVHTASYA